MRQLHRTSPDSTCTALNQHDALLDRTPDLNSPMRSYTGNAETSSLLQGNTVRKRYRLPQWQDNVFRGGSKRAIRLSAIAPDAPANPLLGYSRTDAIHSTRTVTVRNHSWVWHSNSECISALFDVAGIYTRRGNPDSNFIFSGLWIGHFADDQNVPRSALPLIPCRFHGSRLFQIAKGVSTCR